jgi:hypothetical protein
MVRTRGRQIHSSSLIQPSGEGLGPILASTSFTLGRVIMKATGSPSYSAICTRSDLISGFSFLAV